MRLDLLDLFPESVLHCISCSPGGGAGGQAAKDALGNDVTVKSWLATHQKGDRSLTQGLKVSKGRRSDRRHAPAASVCHSIRGASLQDMQLLDRSACSAQHRWT